MTIYKVKVTYKKIRLYDYCTDNDSDNDSDNEKDDIYSDYIEPNSNFINNYCNDEGQVNSDGLDNLSFYSDSDTIDVNCKCRIKHEAISAILININIKADFLEDNPLPPPRPPSPTIRILSENDRIKIRRKAIQCKFGDSCKYHAKGNCRYGH